MELSNRILPRLRALRSIRKVIATMRRMRPNILPYQMFVLVCTQIPKMLGQILCKEEPEGEDEDVEERTTRTKRETVPIKPLIDKKGWISREYPFKNH